MKSILTGYSLILCMWAIFLSNIIIPYDLNQWGVIPRYLGGFPGVFFWSFLHGSFGHIIGNSIALLILIPPIFAMHDEDHGLDIILGIGILAGVINWVIGTTAIHIGASGMVYGLMTYVFFGGIRQKNVIAIVAAVGIFFYMGGNFLMGFVPQPGLSWTGHLAGAIAGLAMAYIVKVPEDRQPQRRRVSDTWFVGP